IAHRQCGNGPACIPFLCVAGPQCAARECETRRLRRLDSVSLPRAGCRLGAARQGGPVREHLANCAFGTLDYIAYPAGMMLLVPAILHVLGIDRFGVWALANAVLMTGAILASGFGDAN